MAIPISRPKSTPGLDRLSQQTQIEFELEFYSSIIRQKADAIDVLRAHAKNLAANRRYIESVQIDRRIVVLRPDDSTAHYNLACSLALIYRIDEALLSLRKAFELGYKDFKFLDTDRDLDSVRKDPRFRELIHEYGPKA